MSRWEEREEKRLVWRDIRPPLGRMRCGRCGKWHAADLERAEMFETCADLAAMMVESNTRAERAIFSESTICVERATACEGTKITERATPEESTMTTERAADLESTKQQERAMLAKSTKSLESTRTPDRKGRTYAN